MPARLQELENEQNVIQGELAYLNGKHLEFNADEILYMLMQYIEPYPNETEQEYHRRIITCFVAEVYAYDDSLKIFFNISSPDGKLQATDLEKIEAGEFDERITSSTNLIAGRTSKAELIILPYGFVLASRLTSPL